MGACACTKNSSTKRSHIYRTTTIQSYEQNRFESNKIENFYLNSHYDLVLDDYNYFFFVDNWFLSESMKQQLKDGIETINFNEQLFFDPEKFVFQYNSYKEDQLQIGKEWNGVDIKEMLEHCVRNSLKSKQGLISDYRSLVRKGVPLKYMKQFILGLFQRSDTEQNQKEYQIYLDTAFDGRVPDDFKNVPLFSEQTDIEEILRFHLLTSKGLLALKRILWTLKETMTRIEYNPMLVQIISILLIFLSESDSYCVIKRLITISADIIDSVEQTQHLKWYFTLNSQDFVKFSKLFFKHVKDDSSHFIQIQKHLTKSLKIQADSLFQDWSRNIFKTFLPFPAVLKIFTIYLNEGIQVYLRISYCLCYSMKVFIQINVSEISWNINNQTLLKNIYGTNH